ncbi:uncharacterized mitochondrial protein AtMg01250-like [Rutidosis leptorrhynchoides]|uniref:uncharacterized mitochondrial protein AtMg01250-like n=1 Tax=Rutidosis leptorrhynchoides TaxID=125765 RepID=UPI003A993130
MGFGEKWITWITSCLKMVTISILVNGSPTKEFNIQRGVRQGDPLSLYLFIMAVEGLNVLMKHALEQKIFKGLEIGSNKIIISHLQYADDTMFFGDWNKKNAGSLIKLLKCFEFFSGLKVNFSKSCLYGVGIRKELVENIASYMGCRVGEFPLPTLAYQSGKE